MEEKRKIHEWEKIYNVDILSYDGFGQAGERLLPVASHHRSAGDVASVALAEALFAPWAQNRL